MAPPEISDLRNDREKILKDFASKMTRTNSLDHAIESEAWELDQASLPL
jgi:hypothetical protein